MDGRVIGDGSTTDPGPRRMAQTHMTSFGIVASKEPKATKAIIIIMRIILILCNC